MNNKKLGSAFEQMFCQRLNELGFWAHFVQPDPRGAQPFDVIAVKDTTAYAFECKTLDEAKVWFPYSRLEYNQIFACEKWLSCGNTMPTIVVLWRGDIYAVPYNKLKESKKVRIELCTKI